MLPPPPLPPMARPVAIIRSTGDLSMITLSPSSTSPPISVGNMASPQQNDHHRASTTDLSHNSVTADLHNHTPPMSPQEMHHQQLDRKSMSGSTSNSLTRLTSTYSTAPVTTARECSFNPFHNSTGQVIYKIIHGEYQFEIMVWMFFFSLQLFSYASSISSMSGVLSPTNLSLYSAPISTSARNACSRSRWNSPLVLEEDFNMITQHPSTMSNSIESNSIILMEEGK